MVPFAIVLADFAPSSNEEAQDVSNVPVKLAAVTDFKKFLLSMVMIFNERYGFIFKKCAEETPSA